MTFEQTKTWLRALGCTPNIMARRTPRTNPPEDVTDHYLLQFPLDELIWDFLRCTHSDASGVPLFVCQGWDRFFRIQETVYREFLLEFYATVSYDPRKTPDNRMTFSFRTGGVIWECSAIELATRVGIYTVDEMRSVHFPAFLADCLTGQLDDYNQNTF
ncbi:unnamed protein product [Lactuca saligna]|uniref:Uncharacterized protein n=1 Tax=Lactuca saligna TaxID=75948 RepID=A0AA36E7G3_LACSI|nr:unnamed protein product [Lactuca saligna]